MSDDVNSAPASDISAPRVAHEASLAIRDFGEVEECGKRRLARAAGLAFPALAVFAMAAASISPRPTDFALYNHSPSMPLGVYIRTNREIALGSIVTVRAADVARAYAGRRDFIRSGDRFIKHVAAVSGARVCAMDDSITINGTEVARRRERDGAGRTLPTWYGCTTLDADHVLLLGETSDSFDGRYWGVSSKHIIEGVWRPLSITQH